MPDKVEYPEYGVGKSRNSLPPRTQMGAVPGECIARIHVTGGWADHDNAQAEATITAAAYHVCRWLLPLDGWRSGRRRWAIALDGGAPGILELNVVLELDLSDLELRIPIGHEVAANALLTRIREQVAELAPVTAGGRDMSTDLPF